MIKKIIISACLLLSLVSFSQEGTSSPYSFYGIGDVKFNGTLENRSIGGLSVAQDTTRINLQNPAGLSNLRWTSFTIGGGSNFSKQKSESASGSTQKTAIDYIALGIPLGKKLGATFGLSPYSSVGYRITNKDSDPSQISTRFNGWGGLNRVFLGFGYEILPNLSAGVSAYYNFGKIQSNSLEYIPNISTGSLELNETDLSGMSFNVGMMYTNKIKEKLSLFTSVYYTPKSTLRTENTRGVSTVNYNSDFDFGTVDAAADVVTKSEVELPQKLSLGVGIGDGKKWLFGTEISFQDEGKWANNYSTIEAVTYGKGERYSLGGYYTPNPNLYANYIKRITYRAGLKFEKTGLIVNSVSINDKSVTFGMGLPVSVSLSNVNIGLEYGQKGTTSSNLVQEDYFNVNVSFSLNDKWFVRSKYR